MIKHKLALEDWKEAVAPRIYEFVEEYNCRVAGRYNLGRRLLTMRDVGWVCKFINDCGFPSWEECYYWSIAILAIEGLNYAMTDSIQGSQLALMKQELLNFLQQQVALNPEWIRKTTPEHIVGLLKEMDFPLLLKTDLPLQVLGILPDSELFFSPQTDLSDLLGQYRPRGQDFVWQDQPLLRCVKEGGVVALVDLNTAQQQVVEGVNSLFDHRGSLFVVELNQTFHKAASFRGVVVLRKEGGNGRRGLPNSFLNRFVKVYVPDVNSEMQLQYLVSKYPYLEDSPDLKALLARLLS
jgi:hypothetical protein